MIEAEYATYLPSSEIRKLNTQIERSMIRGRSFKNYCEMLGLPRVEYLKHQTILDIGTGTSDFTEVAESYGVNVVSIDARYASKLFGSENVPNKCAAYMQYLPFKDNSFNDVLASYSLSWLKLDIKKSLREMIRVTKGGRMHTYMSSRCKA